MSLTKTITIPEKAKQPETVPLLTAPEPVRKKFSINEFRITTKTKIPPLQSVVKIAGSTFAVKGDISFISGPPKAGKSNICAAILGSCFTDRNDEEGDLLKIEADQAGKKKVIYIDTEQPKPYTQQMIGRVMTIARLEKEPENLHVINLREFTSEDRRTFLEQIFDEYTDEHLYFIDGVTDFISSVNDETESAVFINFLMRKSSEKQIPIICVIHENPNGGKLRGHLGSEAERKCGGSIAIRKDRAKGVHWMEARMLRGTSDFDNVYFQWHPTLKRFTLAEAGVVMHMTADNKKSPEERKREELESLINDAFGQNKAIAKDQLITRISAITGKSDKTSDRRVKDAREAGIITFNSNNLFELT